MNEIISKLKDNYKIVLAVGGIILVCVFVWYLFSGRENVSSDRITTDTIRNELNNTQDTERGITATASDIAGTVENLADSIDTATGASKNFEQLINECTDIIEQIRSQPAS